MISALSFLQQADQNNGNAALSALFLLFARKFIHLILSNLYFPVAIYHTWNVLSTELIPVCRTVGWFSPPKRSRQSGDAVFTVSSDYSSMPNSSQAFWRVRSNKSCKSTPFISASLPPVCTSMEESHRTPRVGSGAMYGQSVSISSRSSGTAAAE